MSNSASKCRDAQPSWLHYLVMYIHLKNFLQFTTKHSDLTNVQCFWGNGCFVSWTLYYVFSSWFANHTISISTIWCFRNKTVTLWRELWIWWTYFDRLHRHLSVALFAPKLAPRIFTESFGTGVSFCKLVLDELMCFEPEILDRRVVISQWTSTVQKTPDSSCSNNSF